MVSLGKASLIFRVYSETSVSARRRKTNIAPHTTDWIYAEKVCIRHSRGNSKRTITFMRSKRLTTAQRLLLIAKGWGEHAHSTLQPYPLRTTASRATPRLLLLTLLVPPTNTSPEILLFSRLRSFILLNIVHLKSVVLKLLSHR